MRFHAPRLGIRVAAVLGVVAAILAVLGVTGPATAAAPGRIGPGTTLVTGGRSCTANFVFRDARHRVYLGYAASCATREPVAASAACSARPLPAGTRVRFADGGRTLGYGELRYSSLRALRRAGVTDPGTCAANDFALVEVRGVARGKLDPSVPYWGGPSGLGELPAVGTTMFGLTRTTAAARTLPRAGSVTATSPGTATVSSPLLSARSERGGGFLDASGRAVGILVASTASGDNTVVSLGDAVRYARSHGVAGLRVVRGHEAFTGAAVL